jgi:hypothetical protein
MKGENTRNFEAGILSSNKDFVKNTAEQFDSVWMGPTAKSAGGRNSVGTRLDEINVFMISLIQR